jgi:hypothetical protein
MKLVEGVKIARAACTRAVLVRLWAGDLEAPRSRKPDLLGQASRRNDRYRHGNGVSTRLAAGIITELRANCGHAQAFPDQ